MLFNIAFITTMPTQHLVRFVIKLLNRNSNMCADKIIVSMFRNTQCTCIITIGIFFVNYSARFNFFLQQIKCDISYPATIFHI